jgi:hypothetical protein
MPTTSRSPTIAPRALMASASGVSRSWDMTMGGASMLRTLRMKSEFVPLPAPGAPPSRINSLGNLIVLRPKSPSSSRQTAPKMSCASLTSRSGELVAVATGAAPVPTLSRSISGYLVSKRLSKSWLREAAISYSDRFMPTSRAYSTPSTPRTPSSFLSRQWPLSLGLRPPIRPSAPGGIGCRLLCKRSFMATLALT